MKIKENQIPTLKRNIFSGKFQKKKNLHFKIDKPF